MLTYTNMLEIIIYCLTLSSRGPGKLKWQGSRLQAGQPGFNPGCRRGGDFSPLLRIQTGPGVHSASYKMSTEGFPWG